MAYVKQDLDVTKIPYLGPIYNLCTQGFNISVT